jgi:formylglycine-generating enzyme required for sulfatase activity
VNCDGNYPYGDAPKGKFRSETTEAGTFPPNAFGLYDMHGNVWEWCQDAWHDSYKNAPTNENPWEEGGDRDIRLLRGGSWDVNPWVCRSASRNWFRRDLRYNGIGFRLVCAAPRIL